jgi:hypothetical protein
LKRGKPTGRRVDWAYSDAIRQAARSVQHTAKHIHDLDAVHAWAFKGLSVVDHAFSRLPREAKAVASTALALNAPTTSIPASLAQAWFEASSVEYAAIAERVRSHPLSAPTLAHALLRARSAVQRLLELLPTSSTRKVIDAVDEHLREGIWLQDNNKAIGTALFVRWKNGRAVVERGRGPKLVRANPTREQIADALDMNDDTLKARRKRRTRRAQR